VLYFAYTAQIEPGRMTDAAPGAEFRFIAHVPQHGLDWALAGAAWDGTIPTIRANPEATVWGAVFDIPDADFPGLDVIERDEGRAASEAQAIDRSGKRHRVTVHAAGGAGNGDGGRPSSAYVALMLAGSRHWALPAGWIAGLEEQLAPLG
jgi:hypothetical protein